MADGTILDPGAGGDTIATDDLGATGKVQWVKLRDGTDGGSQTIASGGGTEAAALRVTVASDSTGVVSVDDNGGNISIDDGGNSITVDGTVTANAGTGPFPVSDNAGSLTVDAAAASFAVNQAQVSGTAISVNSGTKDAGTQRVILASDQSVVPISDNAGSLTVDGTVSITANSAVNAAQVAGTATSVNSGTKDAGTQRVILASDQTVVPISDNSGSLTVDNGGTFVVQDSEKIADDAAFTVGTTKVQPIGYLADQASTDSVNEGDIGAARMTLDRKQIVTVAPSSDTEGLSIFRSLDLDETEEDVKTSAGKLYGWYLYNAHTAVLYVKVFNATAANVTVGSTTPVLTIPVPPASGANVEFTNGIAFSTAISAACTTGVADADTGAPAANVLISNFFYS